jgi:putative transposase
MHFFLHFQRALFLQFNCTLYIWCRGYYVDTVGKSTKKIQEYIRNQLQEDIAADQISLKEYIDPFTGESVNKHK